MSVVIIGLERAVAWISTRSRSVGEAGRTVVFVGSNLKYAPFIETGQRRLRNGHTIRRRRGPARMFRRALDERLPTIRRNVAAAIREGHPVRQALLREGYELQRVVQAGTPVVTGTLRRSMHTREMSR